MSSIELDLKLHGSAPSAADFERISDWIVLLPEAAAGARAARIPHAALLRQRLEQAASGDGKEPLVTDLPNAAGTRVALACVNGDLPAFELLTLARKLAAVAAKRRALTLGISVHGFAASGRERLAEAVLSAVYAGAARMPSFKREAKESALRRVELFGTAPAHGYRRTRAEAEGNALARHLSLLPSNRLTPGAYLKFARRIAAERGWRAEFLDLGALARKKAGAFLAVAQGSAERDAGILRLRYAPRGRARGGGIALVGKGICYDTGGVNLKTQRHMYGMHGDMQGSAVALGLMQALSDLKYPRPVECWLALAMNHIGPKAYKPDDVVTAVDGTTIEVVHTDAEGRMVLADTLALAARGRPDLILDFATLTGACAYALGNSYSGVFSNRAAWLPRLVEAGRRSGERVWPFPLDADYDQALESSIADVRQCALEGEADHILAARFLQRFVGGAVPWIHVDLSASRHKGGLAHVPTDMTGFGVRWGLSLLLDGGILGR